MSDVKFDPVDNGSLLLVTKQFTSYSGKRLNKDDTLNPVAIGFPEKKRPSFFIVKCLSDNNEEVICSYDDIAKNIEFCREPIKNEVNVGDRVAILKDGKKFTGNIIGTKRKNYIVSIDGISSFTKVDEAIVNKNSVANIEDCCTIVCDYKKDANGFALRFDYSMSYLKNHMPLKSWGHQGDIFVKER